MLLAKYLGTLLLLAGLCVLLNSAAAATTSFPATLGSDPGLKRHAEAQTWNPENMFEHINGEAELLKRYGAVSLTFVSYENDKGDYFSVDIIDMSTPINAYGLYRLYTGCDGSEYQFSGILISADEFAAQALWGPYYLRFNIDVAENRGAADELVQDFLKTFVENNPDNSSLPAVLAALQAKARKPCELHYHPEHVDYDLESGPGFTWIGPDDQTYFAVTTNSPGEAELQATALKENGVSALLISGRNLIWQQGSGSERLDFLSEIAQAMQEE